jgi:glyoxylase-like metal-dependent hydrolase (beta-lactamase superfamily II)
MVDSPVLPDELELMQAIAAQAQFSVVGLLSTHADWDHLLGSYAFPEAPLGMAESSAARLREEPGAAQRRLRDFDEAMYVDRPRPLGLGDVEAMPVPGHLGIGEAELELHPAEGHTADGMAIRVPWADVLICGDYLSPVEIPILPRGLDRRLPGHADPPRAARGRRGGGGAGPRRAARRGPGAGDPARGPRVPRGTARARRRGAAAARPPHPRAEADPRRERRAGRALTSGRGGHRENGQEQ